ncbi:RnfH family protein [Glaciimonas soli]|uniref:UPF0125 protein GEV47_13160 n=1 Tax=Glaciimonas soli TaxID=2590999 RepID=A0A843YVA9_9BURK|nr:RnfH family protein [Glaciimonas soli]MQR01623.1 RnfH family protein [Glaciimonas soli]
MTAPTITVQVCYATREHQILRSCTVPEGISLHDAIKQSGVLEEVKECDLSTCRVGIFGKLKSLDTPLRDQDRVEIYRPLTVDPMVSRRRRVAKVVKEEARIASMKKSR